MIMVSEIYLKESIWSVPLVELNKKGKPNSHIEETQPDHAIRSAIANTKLLLYRLQYPDISGLVSTSTYRFITGWNIKSNFFQRNLV